MIAAITLIGVAILVTLLLQKNDRMTTTTSTTTLTSIRTPISTTFIATTVSFYNQPRGELILFTTGGPLQSMLTLTPIIKSDTSITQPYLGSNERFWCSYLYQIIKSANYWFSLEFLQYFENATYFGKYARSPTDGSGAPQKCSKNVGNAALNI